MPDTLSPPADTPRDAAQITCREFLGLAGFCPHPGRNAFRGDRFCGEHAMERQTYDVETRRRTGML